VYYTSLANNVVIASAPGFGVLDYQSKTASNPLTSTTNSDCTNFMFGNNIPLSSGLAAIFHSVTIYDRTLTQVEMNALNTLSA
jgi:hypothetical protein